ncbi:MAG: sulfurtransferase TusA family protein [Bacteroides sp.]|nr:sulfurtransferase TusA family protein [Bacteroides sp.]
MFPAYSVYAKTEGPGKLAQSIGFISARDLPVFVEELLAAYLDHKEEYATFGEYIRAAGKVRIAEILARYAEIPSFEEDKNYYYDWGSEQVFSVSERGKAECSAGFFDMIDIDGNIIENSRKALQEATVEDQINDILYDMAHSASRMLLITRGAEPRSTAESYQLFDQLFIDAGLVDLRYKAVTRAAQAKEDLLPLRQDVLSLADAVVALYQTMDDSLQFKTGTGGASAPVLEEAAPAGETVVKDFRGVGCSMNFVKTKLALAPLSSGALLEIWIDDGAPIENVPGSVRNEGHTIENSVQNGDYWQVTIRKK